MLASPLAAAAVLLLLSGAAGEGTGALAGSASEGTPTPGTSTALRTRLERLDGMPFRGMSRPRGQVTIGHSALGRPVHLEEFGGAPGARGAAPRVLAFGCIHGTECAASTIQDFKAGCPAPGAVFFVPNLNPDGLALGTRLNGRGVDLNRNFPASWHPIGQRGDLQYSGPRPFSEPETRLAGNLIRQLRPDITIWFHQEAEPMVRAWGPSVPAARRYARYSGLPFRHLPWLDGTAPNWQNHRFRRTASFVVELPPGPLSRAGAGRQGYAVAALSFRFH